MPPDPAAESTQRRLFEEDFRRLRVRLAEPTGYLRDLRDLMAAHARGEHEDGPRRESGPSRVMLGLLDGSPAAIASARETFLTEWHDGGSLGTVEHYWNSQKFKTEDRWISAAMLAQLLILWDWLAGAGAWTQAEIDEHAGMALGVLEVFVESHLKGRGHMPILHDPINQGAAMSAGLLYAGHLFGRKWRRDPRAVRMYGRGRLLLADHLGQVMKSGYDGDGFTYLRFIHLQCFTLGIALLEEVEGGDWYHRRFAPHDHSLASLNARQFDFVGPGGCSWPLGRYGYIKSWNVFNLAYASRRTGDPRYLQTARRDNARHRYSTPWLRMEIPLALLWYPEELNEEITHGTVAIRPIQECLPDSWAVFHEPATRMQAISLWMAGKAPHFLLEVGDSPLILGGGDAWGDANGVQPGGFDYDLQGWMLPPGRLLRYGALPGAVAAAVETTGAYPPAAEVTRATRTVIHLGEGLVVLSDRFASTRAQAPVWQARVLHGGAVAGRVASLAGLAGVTGRVASADGAFSLEPTGLKRLEHEVYGRLETDWLRIAGRPGNAAFDLAMTWQEGRASSIVRERDDLLAIGDGGRSFAVLLPGAANGRLRRVGAFETDADLAILDGEGRLSVIGARSVRDAGDERLWSDAPLNVTIDGPALAIEGLNYGNFVSYRAAGTFVGIKRGNGLEVYARTPQAFSIRLRGELTGAMVNDLPADTTGDAGWLEFTVPAWRAPAGDLVAELRAATAFDSDRLIPLLNRVRAAMLVEAIPLVRELLTWNGSKITHPSNALANESSHVRMEAARTLACLGDAGALDALLALVETEVNTAYAPGSKWGSLFLGSSARVVAIEALIFLHASQVLPALAKLRAQEGVPHVQDVLERARTILSA